MAYYNYATKSPSLTNKEIACIAFLIKKGCTRGQAEERIKDFLGKCINWKDMERISDDTTSEQAAKKLVEHFNNFEYEVDINQIMKPCSGHDYPQL